MHTNRFLRLSFRVVVLRVVAFFSSDSKFARVLFTFSDMTIVLSSCVPYTVSEPGSMPIFPSLSMVDQWWLPPKPQHWFNCNPKQLQFSNQISEHTHTRSHTRTGVQHTRTHTHMHTSICGMVLVVVACVLTCSLARARYLRESKWNIMIPTFFLFTSRTWKPIECVWSDPYWQTQIGWGQNRYGFWNPSNKTNSSQQNAHNHYLLSVRLRVCLCVWKKRHHHKQYQLDFRRFTCIKMNSFSFTIANNFCRHHDLRSNSSHFLLLFFA